LNNTIVRAIEQGLPDIGIEIGSKRRHHGEELRTAAATRKSLSLLDKCERGIGTMNTTKHVERGTCEAGM
jgi:hypothetical protein